MTICIIVDLHMVDLRKLELMKNELTFNSEIGCTTNALIRIQRGQLPRSALACVIRIVNDSVQLATRPLVNVEIQRRVSRLEVILGIVWCSLAKVDGVTFVVFVNWHAIFEPNDFT